VFVTAAGFGPGWDNGHPDNARTPRPPETPPARVNVLMRLARDDVPVTGRVLDLEG
jgi:hypothetical protein